jgi:hypothetical protein
MGKDKTKDVGAAQVRCGSRCDWIRALRSPRAWSLRNMLMLKNRFPPPLSEFSHPLTLTPPPHHHKQVTEDFAIQPEKITPTLDASKWPLLLKNYDKLMVRVCRGWIPPPRIAGLLLRAIRMKRKEGFFTILCPVP